MTAKRRLREGVWHSFVPTGHWSRFSQEEVGRLALLYHEEGKGAHARRLRAHGRESPATL